VDTSVDKYLEICYALPKIWGFVIGIIITMSKNTSSSKGSLTSLAEIALDVGLPKTKLQYYVSIGLLKPEYTIGRMGIFDSIKVKKFLSSIEDGKKSNKRLKDLKK
jgi:hypothetical protein